MIPLEELSTDSSAITYGVLKPGPRCADGVPMLRVKDVVGGRIDASELYHIGHSLDAEYRRTKLRGGEVLISVQGSVGRVAIVPDQLAGANISRTLAVIPPAIPELSNWLWLALQEPGVQKAIRDATGGTTRDSLNIRDLKMIGLPLPPTLEQYRIVNRVKELAQPINVAEGHLYKVSAILKRFRQAVLAAACSGRLTEDWRQRNPSVRPTFQTAVGNLLEKNADLPNEWRVASVEVVCEVIVDCPHSTPRWTTAGVICVRTTNFKAGLLDLSDVRFVSESTYKERTSRLAPKSGDILYSREGGILGIACMVPSDARLCLGQRMMLMRVNASICDSTFLMHVLNSPTTLESVRDLTGGSASPHLNVADIKTFPVALPPLLEQQEIVGRVGALLSLADAIEKRTAIAGRFVDQLTQSILAKAFRGELVPTEAELARREGRDYEPASVLLERIRAERASHITTPSRKRNARKPSAHV